MKTKDKKVEKRIKELSLGYNNEYLGIFTGWVKQYFVLATFPDFLFKDEGVFNEVGCGACIRCLLQFEKFESLDDISYNSSIETKAIFPSVTLNEWVRVSEEIFDGIKGELWRGDS